jgi:chemotaxis protein MotB
MRALSRRGRHQENTWPGFVDALATLLMVIIFLLMIFVLAQFVLNAAISGRDARLVQLETRINELADLLALERDTNADLRANVGSLSQELQASIGERDDLKARVVVLGGQVERAQQAALDMERSLENALAELASTASALEASSDEVTALIGEVADLQSLRDRLRDELDQMADNLNAAEAARRQRESELQTTRDDLMQARGRIAALSGDADRTAQALAAEKELSAESRAELALVNRQLAALREQLAQLNAALEASEQLNADQKATIEALGSRLNAALATKVQELARYRSEFFGRLREILGTRSDIRIVGDRFVFQSEVLFEQGSAELGTGGRTQLDALAETLIALSKTIPDDIDWVLRVDGHTDKVPIQTFRFPSNWELSAARAISVVKYLADAGLPADRLAAAAFGAQQPLDPGSSEEAYRRNRRIEFKLDRK